MHRTQNTTPWVSGTNPTKFNKTSKIETDRILKKPFPKFLEQQMSKNTSVQLDGQWLEYLYFSPFKNFEQLCTYPEKQNLPWNFSLYSIYFLHSGYLSNLRLPWIRCIEYTFCSDVQCGSWLGRHCLFQVNFASVWIECSSRNSLLNWLFAEWRLLMLSISYHNLLHTYRYNGDSRFEKN